MLPNRYKEKNADGFCASYDIVLDDSCSVVAIYYSIDVDKLENFN